MTFCLEIQKTKKTQAQNLLKTIRQKNFCPFFRIFFLMDRNFTHKKLIKKLKGDLEDHRIWTEIILSHVCFKVQLRMGSSLWTGRWWGAGRECWQGDREMAVIPPWLLDSTRALCLHAEVSLKQRKVCSRRSLLRSERICFSAQDSTFCSINWSPGWPHP